MRRVRIFGCDHLFLRRTHCGFAFFIITLISPSKCDICHILRLCLIPNKRVFEPDFFRNSPIALRSPSSSSPVFRDRIPSETAIRTSVSCSPKFHPLFILIGHLSLWQCELLAPNPDSTSNTTHPTRTPVIDKSESFSLRPRPRTLRRCGGNPYKRIIIVGLAVKQQGS